MGTHPLDEAIQFRKWDVADYLRKMAVFKKEQPARNLMRCCKFIAKKERVVVKPFGKPQQRLLALLALLHKGVGNNYAQ